MLKKLYKINGKLKIFHVAETLDELKHISIEVGICLVLDYFKALGTRGIKTTKDFLNAVKKHSNPNPHDDWGLFKNTNLIYEFASDANSNIDVGADFFIHVTPDSNIDTTVDPVVSVGRHYTFFKVDDQIYVMTGDED